MTAACAVSASANANNAARRKLVVLPPPLEDLLDYLLHHFFSFLRSIVYWYEILAPRRTSAAVLLPGSGRQAPNLSHSTRYTASRARSCRRRTPSRDAAKPLRKSGFPGTVRPRDHAKALRHRGGNSSMSSSRPSSQRRTTRFPTSMVIGRPAANVRRTASALHSRAALASFLSSSVILTQIPLRQVEFADIIP